MISEDLKLKLYSKMFFIRAFEEKLVDLFRKGKLFGTIHGCIGQEGIAVSVISALPEGTIYFSNHRCHGHFLAYTDDPASLLAELMGKEGGACGGRGGSQHLCYRDFYSNGIQGGIVPIATGMAFAEKLKKTGRIVCVFLGDGTLGQGVVYESMNIASLWELPILFVLENNQYAMSTSVKNAVAGSIEGRPISFGIRAESVSSSDIFEMSSAVKNAFQYIHAKGKPTFLVFETYRFCGHSKSDDCLYRTIEEAENWKKKDPLIFLRNTIKDNKKRELVEQECLRRMKEVIQKVGSLPPARIENTYVRITGNKRSSF